jgi:glucan 1,3-beta-glucosidase
MRAASLLASLLGVAAAQMQFESEAPSLKIRGVNLGGWLVLEKWIKPSLFAEWDPLDKKAPKDQWTYCETLGPAECKKRLEKHWDSWVSEQTIADLAAAGITHVRVPMGHWITCDVSDDEPYVCGEWSYLVRAMGWCRAHGIKVWLDLHTAPGSQNGFDNSGRLGAATWDSNTGNANRTVAVVEKISQRVKDEGLLDVVTGFGLLNEPDQHIKYWRMLHYYNDAYAAIRSILGEDVAVYIGDMFNPQSFNWFWPSSDDPSLAPPNREAENVFLDSHIYACFVDDLKAMTPKQHITQLSLPVAPRRPSADPPRVYL